MNRVVLPLLPPSTPEGWYPDPSSYALSRFWDGSAWTDLAVVAPEIDAKGKRRLYHPLSRGERPPLWRILAVFVLLAVPALALGWLLSSAARPGSSLMSEALAYVVVIFFFTYCGRMAAKVDYRWFDSISLLVPIWGFVWFTIIFWRNAKLPYRDWKARPEVYAADPLLNPNLVYADESQSAAASCVVEGDAQRS